MHIRYSLGVVFRSFPLYVHKTYFVRNREREGRQECRKTRERKRESVKGEGKDGGGGSERRMKGTWKREREIIKKEEERREGMEGGREGEQERGKRKGQELKK